MHRPINKMQRWIEHPARDRILASVFMIPRPVESSNCVDQAIGIRGGQTILRGGHASCRAPSVASRVVHLHCVEALQETGRAAAADGVDFATYRCRSQPP
jgi:hypothetical protein